MSRIMMGAVLPGNSSVELKEFRIPRPELLRLRFFLSVCRVAMNAKALIAPLWICQLGIII
jgi:hypothetical protein